MTVFRTYLQGIMDKKQIMFASTFPKVTVAGSTAPRPGVLPMVRHACQVFAAPAGILHWILIRSRCVHSLLYYCSNLIVQLFL
jgi:hypothetical protein